MSLSTDLLVSAYSYAVRCRLFYAVRCACWLEPFIEVQRLPGAFFWGFERCADHTAAKLKASLLRCVSAVMARKKSQRKQETTLVPHRTPHLSVLRERAQRGDSAQAVRAYLDACGSPITLVRATNHGLVLQLPLFLNMAYNNAHPHKELAESVRLLVDASADINSKTAGTEGTERTVLVCAIERGCCSKLLKIFLELGADPSVHSTSSSVTALMTTAQKGIAQNCRVLLERADALVDATDAVGQTALIHAAAFGHLHIVKLYCNMVQMSTQPV
jgi:Ankyrin repeats (3 copies)